MKIALVFDDLIQFGGAEALLLTIHDLYPNAPVYTSVVSDKWIGRCKDLKIDLKTSFMQKLPFKKLFNRLYGLLGLHALAFAQFNLDQFDLVLSISARFAHGIITKPGTINVCYMNSPGRMFWESHNYLERETIPMVLVVPFISLLRLWDFTAAQRVDYFIANSHAVHDRIIKYYHRDSIIIYPCISDAGPSICHSGVVDVPGLSATGPPQNDDAFFLVITRLNAWKRVDIAIEACKKLSIPLKIIGTGSDLKRLKKISDGRVEFLGHLNDQAKYEAILGCRALIVTQKEDFGITALEAMACGKPVIAYRSGGVLETVVDGVTGAFFDEQTLESLAGILVIFDSSIYKPEDCKNQAGRFSQKRFAKELDDSLKKVYDEKNRPR